MQCPNCHQACRRLMKRLQSNFPPWLAVLVMLLIFGSIPVTMAHRAVHRFQLNDQILEASTFTKLAKQKVAAYTDGDTSPAPDNAAVGLPEPAAIRSRYVTSLEVRNGTIVVTLGAQAAEELQGKHLLFTFTRGQDHMDHWQCTSADIARSLHPIACM